MTSAGVLVFARLARKNRIERSSSIWYFPPIALFPIERSLVVRAIPTDGLKKSDLVRIWPDNCSARTSTRQKQTGFAANAGMAVLCSNAQRRAAVRNSVHRGHSHSACMGIEG